MMPYKRLTFPIGEKAIEKVIPMRMKWKNLLLDVDVVGEKVGLEPISLSKLRAIKKENLNDYITKRHGDKFTWDFKCKTLNCLWGVHAIGTESYTTHQLNYVKYVNMQKTYYNDYYTIGALSIVGPLEVLTVILDKNKFIMFCALNQGYQWIL